MVFNDRAVYQEVHAAHLIMARRLDSPPTGRIHLRRPVIRPWLFPCSRAADHTFSGTSIVKSLNACIDLFLSGDTLLSGRGLNPRKIVPKGLDCVRGKSRRFTMCPRNVSLKCACNFREAAYWLARTGVHASAQLVHFASKSSNTKRRKSFSGASFLSA
jgi:hypothetical protein